MQDGQRRVKTQRFQRKYACPDSAKASFVPAENSNTGAVSTRLGSTGCVMRPRDREVLGFNSQRARSDHHCREVCERVNSNVGNPWSRVQLPGSVAGCLSNDSKLVAKWTLQLPADGRKILNTAARFRGVLHRGKLPHRELFNRPWTAPEMR